VIDLNVCVNVWEDRRYSRSCQAQRQYVKRRDARRHYLISVTRRQRRRANMLECAELWLNIRRFLLTARQRYTRLRYGALDELLAETAFAT